MKSLIISIILVIIGGYTLMWIIHLTKAKSYQISISIKYVSKISFSEFKKYYNTLCSFTHSNYTNRYVFEFNNFSMCSDITVYLNDAPNTRICMLGLNEFFDYKKETVFWFAYFDYIRYVVFMIKEFYSIGRVKPRKYKDLNEEK